MNIRNKTKAIKSKQVVIEIIKKVLLRDVIELFLEPRG